MRQTHIMLNISDWRADTMGMSKRLKGFYIDFLGHYYRNGGPVRYDEDELTRELGYKNVRSLRVDLHELLATGKVYTSDGPEGRFLINNRSDEEIRKYEAKKQAQIDGGRNGKPYSKNPRQTHAAPGAAQAPEPGENPASTRNQRDISSISARYHAENAPQIEENQSVSGNSSSILNLITTTAHAHARGPVVVIPDPADEPAPGRAASRPATPAPSVPQRPSRPSPSAHDPVLPKNAFARSNEPPEPGSDGYDAWVRKQQRLEITAKVEALCGEVLRQGSMIDSAYIGAWLSLGADPDLHIYPVVTKIVGEIAARGKQVWGAKIFDEEIRRKITLEDEVVNNPAPAKSQTKSWSKDRSGQTSRQTGPVSKDVLTTLKMAKQNEWDALFGEMRRLMTAANEGDQESLRLLNDLHAKHQHDVLVPHSVWLTQQQSTAA